MSGMTPPELSREALQAIKEVILELKNMGNATRDSARATKDEAEERGRSTQQIVAESAGGFAKKRGRAAAAAAGTDLVDQAMRLGLEGAMSGEGATRAMKKGLAAAGDRTAEDELDIQANAEARTLAMWEPAIRTGQISVEQAMPFMRASLGLRGAEEVRGVVAGRELRKAATEMFQDVEVSGAAADSMVKKAYEAMQKTGANWGGGG